MDPGLMKISKHDANVSPHCCWYPNALEKSPPLRGDLDPGGEGGGAGTWACRRPTGGPPSAAGAGAGMGGSRTAKAARTVRRGHAAVSANTNRGPNSCADGGKASHWEDMPPGNPGSCKLTAVPLVKMRPLEYGSMAGPGLADLNQGPGVERGDDAPQRPGPEGKWGGGRPSGGNSVLNYRQEPNREKEPV